MEQTMQYPFYVERDAEPAFRASFPDFPAPMVRAIRSKS